MQSHFLLGHFQQSVCSLLSSVINQLMTCLFSGPISCLERSEYSMKSVLLQDRKWDYVQDYIVLLPVLSFLTIEKPESLNQNSS